MIRAPMCPELTVERVFKQVQGDTEIMRFLSDLTDNGKQYIERDFLFAIVNTIDKNYFRELMAEIEMRRAKKAAQGEQGMIEIYKNLFGLLQQIYSHIVLAS